VEAYLIVAAIVFVGYCIHGLSFGGGAGLASTFPVAVIMGLLWPVTILRVLLAFLVGSAVQKVVPDKEPEK
jgi:uncharacterized membrane protein